MRINLSDGTSFEGVLVVRNVTGFAEQRGFRLYWDDPDGDGMMGVDGDRSARLHQTAIGCAHSGLYRFNIWPKLYLEMSDTTRTIPGEPA